MEANTPSACAQNASPEDVAKASHHLESGDARLAFKADRDWFARHSGRRYRLRPLLLTEDGLRVGGVTHVRPAHQSRNASALRLAVARRRHDAGNGSRDRRRARH